MKTAVIYANNPPLNTLNCKTRRVLYDEIEEAINNKNVNGIVVCGAGKAFCAGADIREFDRFHVWPTINDIVKLLARSEKPTVCGIHGVAFGGGLELALGCHFRVAVTSTLLGLPEVLIGMLPAGGATQLLPRLIGLDKAMHWITSGKKFSAEEAKQTGVIDVLVDDMSQLLATCKTMLHGKDLPQSLSLRHVEDAARADAICTKYMRRAKSRSRGASAPITCLQITKLSTILPFNEGVKKERAAFDFLYSGAQAKASLYRFFGERQNKKWTAVDDRESSKPKKVDKAGVVGLGTMGSGIVICLLQLGIPVKAMEMDADKLQTAISGICREIDEMSGKRVITVDQAARMKSNLIPVQHIRQFAIDVDLVIEAVYESMELKRDIFVQLDIHCKRSCILATNTSTLDIDELASYTLRPQQVIGMHFFAPAHRMKLLENIRGRLTSPATISTAMDIGLRMNKVTILVGNCHGFVVNRMYFQFLRESEFMLEEGAYPEQIDATMREFGFPMGRFEVTDVAGNDVHYRVAQSLGRLRKQQAPGTSDRLRGEERYCPLTEILVESGRHGYKTGLKGWFRYEAPFSRPQVDSVVTSLIDQYRHSHNIEPRRIDPEEIVERMLYSMVNEGFKILEERIATSPLDVDLAWMNGMAWPKHTGGPMFYASTVGLPKVLKAINRRWKAAGIREPHWKPSKMLVYLVEKFGNPNISEWTNLAQSAEIFSNL